MYPKVRRGKIIGRVKKAPLKVINSEIRAIERRRQTGKATKTDEALLRRLDELKKKAEGIKKEAEEAKKGAKNKEVSGVAKTEEIKKKENNLADEILKMIEEESQIEEFLGNKKKSDGVR